MSLRKLLNQPLSIQSVTAGGLDGYNDETSASVGAPVSVLGYLEQVSSIENLVNRDTTVSSWQAYLPAHTVIDRNDYINFQAQRFQVDGEPEHAYNPRTKRVSHIICKLVVING